MKSVANKTFFFLFSLSTEEWVKIDIAWKVKNWIEENDLEHVIDISCNTCEKHPSMDMLSLDQGYRPFIVINTHPSRKIKRQRRSVNCSPGVTECCREKLYISFAEIGWDDWSKCYFCVTVVPMFCNIFSLLFVVLHPPGYHAYFCRGSCESAAAITRSGSYYTSVIRVSYRTTYQRTDVLNISKIPITEIHRAQQTEEQKLGIDTVLYGNSIFIIAASVHGE